MNAKQIEALKCGLTGHNLLVHGQAGTGKSYVMLKLAQELKIQGKSVHITCTTGIATRLYPASLHPMTVHKWCGMNDGRYDVNTIVQLIKTSPAYEVVLNRIKSADVLIIDEISMMSAKCFDQLSQILSLVRGGDVLFGGLQIILTGDFHQLPPVGNELYCDDGSMCFTSAAFQGISHRVVLTDIVRQKDKGFAAVVGKVARGICDDTVINFMNEHSRPLPEDNQQCRSIKLFSTNLLLEDYNREKILAADGELVEFRSTDEGSIHYIQKLIAPQTLWLKVGAPVILLRNLSHSLVNGLRGIVISFKAEGPEVAFENGITTVLKRTEFCVYSPADQKNLATRLQIPLKLAYGLTIHKSQGMTLDRVEVDCRCIFKAGQLGVAIGRATTAEGLRVINFNERACIPQPDSIDLYLSGTTDEPLEDLSCCKQTRQVLKGNPTQPVVPGIDLDQEPEEEFDDDFDKFLETIDCEAPGNGNLLEDFDLRKCLDECVVKSPVTPKQVQINSIIEHMSTEQEQRLKSFCQKVYDKIDQCYSSPDDLNEFYRQCHQFQTSDQYRVNVMLCFVDAVNLDAGHWFVCYKLTAAVRNFILVKKAAHLPSSDRELGKRSTTDASRGRIRYVGGYCVSVVRQEQIRLLTRNMYCTTVLGQCQYQDSKEMLAILDCFREEESSLFKSTNDPSSLQDTTRKQNVNRGLTHISDNIFDFFLMLCDNSLNIINDKNLNEYGELFYQYCQNKLASSVQLESKFNEIVNVNMKACPIATIYPGNKMKVFNEIVKRFVKIMLNQFRSDLLHSFQVGKTMAHRQQIQLKKQKKDSVQHVSFQAVLDDKTENKEMSHSLMKGMLLKQTHVFESMTIPQIKCICRAYGLKILAKGNKRDTINSLTAHILQSNGMCDVSVIIHPSTEQQPGTSTGCSNDLCKRCQKVGRAGIGWIQCDRCKSWIHRNCAGLSSKRKWDQVVSTGSCFFCSDCSHIDEP